MLTRRCNMQCGHCSVESHPKVAHQPSPEDLLDRLDKAAQAGVESILLTGGEPMLREDCVIQLLQRCRQLGLLASMTSNGFWGRKAQAKVPALKKAGLTSLNLSYDRYHAEFIGPDPIAAIAREARKILLPCALVVTHTREQEDLEALIAPFRSIPGLAFRFYDVQPVGAARKFAGATFSGRLDGYCQACQAPALTDQGKMTACNGPAHFSPDQSPLQIGDLQSESMSELLERHNQDVILETIRTHGPQYLLEQLQDCPEFEAKSEYLGMCDICVHVTSSPMAVAHLREKLAQDQETAYRLALSKVIQGSRRQVLTREQINGVALGKVLLGILNNQPDPLQEQVLTRSDLDWVRACKVISQSGLAASLLEHLPPRAQTLLEPYAQRSALRQLLLRDALSRIEETLAEFDQRGILLKGAAQLAGGGQRSTGDIDLWLPSPLAQQVHQVLIQRGWQAHSGAARHHLTPISFQGIPLEIHTQIMPAFWGFPHPPVESLLPTPWPHLDRLDCEYFALHALVHCSKHLYEDGFKTAYDLLWNGPLDGPRFTTLVRQLRLPLAAWAPLAFLQKQLPHPRLNIPSTRSLDRLVAARFFHPSRGERNPFLRLPLYLALQPNLWEALRSFSFLFKGGRPDARSASSSWREDLIEAAGSLRRALRK